MKNHVVLVTGASSGIGRATAEKFLEAGARVILVARRKDKLAEIASAYPALAWPVELDLTDSEAVERCLATLPGDFSPVSILVNNAGAAFGMEAAWQAELSNWDKMVDLNIKSLLLVTRLILPIMVEAKRGHIINLGSVAGTYPYPGGNVYGACKAFVEQFSHNLRCDLHGQSVRVTNIEPGLVETEFSLVRFAGDASKAEAVYQGLEPMTAADIAESIFWCATLPERVNVNRMELMASMQSAAGFRFHRQE